MKLANSLPSILLLLPAAIPSVVTICLAVISPVLLIGRFIKKSAFILIILMLLYFFIGVTLYPLNIVASQFITPFLICFSLIITFGKRLEMNKQMLLLVLPLIVIMDATYLPYHNKGFVSVILLSFLLPSRNKYTYTSILIAYCLYFYIITYRTTWLFLLAFTLLPLARIYMTKMKFLVLIIITNILMVSISQMPIFDLLTALESNLAIRVKMLEHAVAGMRWQDWIFGIGFGTPYRTTDAMGAGHFSPIAVLYVSNHNSYFDLLMRFGIIIAFFVTKFLPEVKDNPTLKLKQSFIYSYLFVWGEFNASFDSGIAFSGAILAIILLNVLVSKASNDLHRIAI